MPLFICHSEQAEIRRAADLSSSLYPEILAHLALHPALSSNGLGWDNEEKHQIISISRSIAGKAVVAPRHDKHPPTQERSISVKSPGYISACNGSVIVRHDQHLGGFDV